MPEVSGEIDRGHPALAELALDLVATGKRFTETRHLIGHSRLFPSCRCERIGNNCTGFEGNPLGPYWISAGFSSFGSRLYGSVPPGRIVMNAPSPLVLRPRDRAV
jgi:hypothetical protein